MSSFMRDVENPPRFAVEFLVQEDNAIFLLTLKSINLRGGHYMRDDDDIACSNTRPI